MPYQPLYHWRRTKIDESDIPTDNDWCGYDGETVIGRVQLQTDGPMRGRWHWSGIGPHVRSRPLPHTGYVKEGREAMREVEEFYHRLMAANGLRGSKQA